MLHQMAMNACLIMFYLSYKKYKLKIDYCFSYISELWDLFFSVVPLKFCLAGNVIFRDHLESSQINYKGIHNGRIRFKFIFIVGLSEIIILLFTFYISIY